MTQTMWIMLVVTILAIFSLVIMIDRADKKRRQDDRDAVKADDIRKNPGLLDKSQQAAELQIGEADEKRQPGRFKPDEKANRRAASGK